jgi:hypothetical protein
MIQTGDGESPNHQIGIRANPPTIIATNSHAFSFSAFWMRRQSDSR